MQLQITFADGSIRTINVHPDFFKTDLLFNKKTKKMEPISPSVKAKLLAQSLGVPHVLTLTSVNGAMAYHKIFHENAPEGPKTLTQAQKEAELKHNTDKKTLRKKFKSHKFTSKWIL